MDLEPLLDRFRGPLIGFFAGQGNAPRDAQELAQDVFVEAYLSRERFGGDWSEMRAVGAWLRGIAGNLLHTERRRRGRSPRPIDDVEPVDPDADDPAGAVERDEARERLRAAIDGLRGPWRTVLCMHYLEGSGLAEIGALLGISTRAVEGRLRRARQELKSAIERLEEAQR